MNRINPIYIILLLIVVLGIVFFKLESAKDEFEQLQKSYKESFKLAKKLSELKKTYRQKLILPSSIASKVNQKKLKNGVAISSKHMDIKTLDALMGRVLNGAYRIKKLTIKKLAKTQVSFYMEIVW